ncbi:hypothetical protein ACFE04_029867 [Oxalis oulophora]
MSSTSEWVQIYQQNIQATSTQSILHSAQTSDATTTIRSMAPEGRLTKPTRKRRRASRRTPTTLLNTDTTNFRAMVQQFTSSPIPTTMSFSSSQNFTLTFGDGSVRSSGGGGGFHLQYQQSMAPPQINHQQQPYMFTFAGSGGDGDNGTFVQRLGSRPNNIAEGFAMENIHSNNNIVQLDPFSSLSENNNFMFT